MQNNTKPKLDALDITDRLRNYRRRTVMPVKPRSQSNHLRRRVGMDVWESAEQLEIPKKPISNTKHLIKAPNVPPLRTKVKLRQKSSGTISEAPQCQTKITAPDTDNDFVTKAGQINVIDFEASAKDYKQAKKIRFKGLKFGKQNMFNYALYGMAVMVFVVGILAALRSFAVDHKIAQTASAQANNQLASGDVEEDKPNDDAIRNYSVAPDMPKVISINNLNVKARVRQLNVKSDGSLDAPKNIHDAGWYSQSAKPGSPGGAAIIDGHVSGPTQKGVFYKIETLKSGDSVVVERGDGSHLEYVVKKVEVNKASDLDMTKLMLPVTTGKHGLNLITCTGKFDSKTKTYEDRALVYTEFVKSY